LSSSDRLCTACLFNTIPHYLFRRRRKFLAAVRKVVLEDRPQSSHCQWWRISPLATYSDISGAIMGSPQCGQRIDAAKELIPAGFGHS
jgi:hypothetical protein